MAAVARGVPAAGLRQRAEQIAALLPPLLVEAERIATTVAQGVHGRRRVGTGDAFWQFRRYQPGDSTTLIDWRQTAKREHPFIRQNEWEAAESVWLWRDGSSSMAWHSRFAPAEKRERATLLLLALATLLLRGGERVGLLTESRLPANGRFVLDRLVQTLESEPPGEDVSLPPKRELPRYAQIVLIGDFLSPIEEIDALVRHYAGSGVKGHLLQTLDPAEEDLPWRGRARFFGLEGESPFVVSRVETLRSDWDRHFKLHQESLRDLARRVGWSFALHRTDRPPQTALLALYGALAGGLPIGN